MGKTILELTSEERRIYHPSSVIAQRKRVGDKQLDARWEQAQKLANKVAELLRKNFGATKVILFGSLLNRAWFTQWSDIDLAAWGIPKERYFAAVAYVTGLSQDFRIDLIDPETCRPNLLEVINKEGIEI